MGAKIHRLGIGAMVSVSRFQVKGADLVLDLDVDGFVDRKRGLDYRASEALANAVNTALVLGRPLLVSGEPGCGKTELGFAIARKLGVGRLNFFAVKSDVESQRLFYEFDAVRRFHAAQIPPTNPEDRQSATDPRRFIQYQALGRAILDATDSGLVKDLLPYGEKALEQRRRSVVVIDEIDKAPRDFANDLLNELDQLWFRVPELAGVAFPPETPRDAIAKQFRPIVVVTSNLERQLPDAFLRRCVFFHIEHPTKDQQEEILVGHLSRAGEKLDDGDFESAIDLVDWSRRQAMDRAPGLAELLEFARALALRKEDLPGSTFKDRAQACVGALGKTTRDQTTLRNRIDGL